LSSHSIHDFWPKVDEELEDLHDAGPEDFLECDSTFFYIYFALLTVLSKIHEAEL
jgi:hypothetical protein